MWGQLQYLQQQAVNIHIVAIRSLAVRAKFPNEPELTSSLPHRVSFISMTDRWVGETDEPVVRSLQAIVDEEQPDIIWSVYADFAPLLAEIDTHAKLVLRPINFELGHYVEKRMTDNGLMKGTWRLRFFRWRQFLSSHWRLLWRIYQAERTMFQIADYVLHIGWRDKQVMGHLYRSKVQRCWVPPLIEAPKIPVKQRPCLHVLYLGSTFHYVVNRIGAEKLIEEIIPAVTDAMPDAFHFHIVGRYGQDYFQNDQHTTIYGFVDDLEAFLQDMDIACIPVETGWGCKLKMLDSIARGLPVIGAKQTFRGVMPVDDVYFACETLQEYIDAFASLRDDAIREQLSLRGIRTYERWRGEATRTIDRILSEIESNP